MELLSDILVRLRDLRDLSGFGHVFLLIDPQCGHVPLERWTSQIGTGKHWMLRDPQVRDPRFPCPQLLLLGEEDDAILEESVRSAGALDNANSVSRPNPAICGWLFARGIAADLPRHLVAAAQQRNAKYEPVLMRYYDSRVLPYLNQILEPEQRRQLLGPVSHWIALDRFGHSTDLQTQMAAQYVSPGLALTVDQWSQVERIEAVNRSFAAFNDLTGDPLPVDREPELMLALERAAKNGITALDDLMTFALYALSIRPDFDQHPLVAGTVRSMRTGSTLADEFSQLPAHVWSAPQANESKVKSE
jgi:hypothetical protein